MKHNCSHLVRVSHYLLPNKVRPDLRAFVLACLGSFLGLLMQVMPVAAMPANPQPYPFAQPDGSVITLHVRGDEWFHWYETVDGRPVALDPVSSYWVYLQPGAPGTIILTTERVGLDQPTAAAWQPRPTQEQLNMAHVSASVFSPSTNSNASSKNVLGVGTAFVPLVFADFSDTNHVITSGTISNQLFNIAPGARSMAAFYNEVSYGKFTVAAGPSGVQDWVKVGHTAAYYAPNLTSSGNANTGTAVAQFVHDAVVAAIAAGYKFAPYDQAGTGKVPVVDVVHAGRGQEDGGGPNAIWSNRSSFSGNGLAPIIADGGVVIDDYVVEPELQLAGTTNAPSTIGVFCHEFGHAMGLPDLYDTDYTSYGVGNWSVMGYGVYNLISRSGDCPAHFDAWCKMKLGWVSPINYTLNYQNVQFPYAASNAFAARLWKDGLASQEYYLVENRFKAGFDAGLPSSGLLIWHIDDSKGVKNDNSDNRKEWFPITAGALPPNTNSGNLHVALVQADNLWQIESKQNQGDTGDPFPGSANKRVFGPTTAPSSYAYNVGLTPGYNSFVTVSNISNAGLMMTADLYTRSPNSGPSVNWVNIAGVVPPSSGAQFVQLDNNHPVVIQASPGVSGTTLSQLQLYLNRSADGRWWNFDSQQWETNATSSNYNVAAAQQNGLTFAFNSGLPFGTNLLNGGYVFTIRVIDALSVVTQIQMAMTAVHAPEVNLSLADNSVVNTLTNFTAVATENSGVGVQRVDIALYWQGQATEGGSAVTWYWSGSSWSTTPMWLGADFAGHPAQATLYYPIGPDAANLQTDKQYFIAARAVDALGDATTNIISAFYDPGSPATIYWRYGASGNWFDPANWTPERVPLSTDNVVVNAPGDYTVTVNGTVNIASLRFASVIGLYQQHLSLPSGAVLSIGGTDTNKIYAAGTLDMAGYCSAGILQFSAGATFNWSGGTLDNGDYRVPAGTAFNLSGDSVRYLSSAATLTTGGVGTWSGLGQLNAANGSLLINNGTLTVTGDAAAFNYTGGLPRFINNGTWIKAAGTNTTLRPDNGGVAFDNNGVLNVMSGVFSLGGGGTGSNGTFTASAGARIELAAGSFGFSGTTTYSGVGATHLLGGTLTYSGPSAFSGGGTLAVDGGGVEGASVFTGTGTFNWTGGQIDAALTLPATANFNLSGDNTRTLSSAGILTSGGVGTWSGLGQLNAANGSQLINNGTMTVTGDAVAFNYTGGLPRFINNGTLIKNGSTGVTTFLANNGGVEFDNNGTVDLRTGSLAFNGGYTLSGSPKLKFALGGLNPGTQFGQETFGGAATLGGILSVTLTNGFVPTNGQTFVLATYPSSTGQFSSTQLAPLPVDVRWQLTYGASSLLLQVVPSNVFQAASLTNGQFQFTFQGQTGSSCFIEVSTNLVNWGPLLTNTPFNGILNYVDPQTAQFSKRFYRATIFP